MIPTTGNTPAEDDAAARDHARGRTIGHLIGTDGGTRIEFTDGSAIQSAQHADGPTGFTHYILWRVVS